MRIINHWWLEYYCLVFLSLQWSHECATAGPGGPFATRKGRSQEIASSRQRKPWGVATQRSDVGNAWSNDNDHNDDDGHQLQLEVALTSEEIVWTADPLLSKSPYIYIMDYSVSSEILSDAGTSHDDDEKHTSSSNEKDDVDNNARSAESASEHNSPEESVVGVKAHPSKKSNAVGDPDGDDSDDEDDDDFDEITDEEWETEIQERLDHMEPNDLLPTQVQVEVELLGEGGTNDSFGTTTTTTTTTAKSNPLADAASAAGGVGIKLGTRLKNYRRKKEKSRKVVGSNDAADRETQLLLQAWLPHVFLPPTPAACDFLKQHARSMDASSKVRLDRRTLYSGLLWEWNTLTWDDSKTTTKSPSQQSRKFLDAVTSQTLQAAMSLATQPQWREAYRLASPDNGLRFYYKEGESSAADRAPTVGMQETIAMALAHSLGCGMVILDDTILSSLRQQLAAKGFSDDALKPAALLKALLNLSRQGKLSRNGREGGLLSNCMQRDLAGGLDDPFDDRATSSINEMVKWEQAGRNEETAESGKSTNIEAPLPLLIFVRTESSASLLNSKSAVEILIKECESSDGINLIALGKGVDANTITLPQEPSPSGSGPAESQESQSQNQFSSGAPWFGFPAQNQNASGQNDPEGSRRFNIFLTRTVDDNGRPGIMGAIAPPQAGNLFPHMMAMRAREQQQQQKQMQQGAEASPDPWAQMMQQQMEATGGSPLPLSQFFNTTLSPFGMDASSTQPPPPEVIHQTLQQVLSELLDRLAQENDDGEASSEFPTELHHAFAQILRNENLRQGIAENLARAVPALSDPKCQGVMLSVFVPPFQIPPGMQPNQPPTQPTETQPQVAQPNQPKNANQPSNNIINNNSLMGNWFQKLLNSQENNEVDEDDDSEEEERRKKNSRQKRVRTLAAAAAVMAANSAGQHAEGAEKAESKAETNLSRLEALCKPIQVKVPSDPVRAKSWEAWIARERGAVVFRHNRKALNDELASRNLSLQLHTGTNGAGSALRQMLSVRDISAQMANVVRSAVELEARKSQRLHESSYEMHQKEKTLEVDETLAQLLLGKDGGAISSISDLISATNESKSSQFLHPSSLETAITSTCRISPSPNGGLYLAGQTASHRTKEEILALAQDKHERALVAQVVSPQDIGVSYDMIGGLTDVKELLRQSITYPLKFPHLYSEGIAREAVKGVLLFGPPGTGKTMLAKAVATEGGASFLSVDAASVENKWLGESEKNARAIFTLARRLAPCVIFIDEVDSLLSSREGSSDDSAHGTLTSVKTTIMSEWDGLNSGTNGNGEAGSDRVIVIGSTNRPFDLDEAVLRRFPRRILVDLPNLDSRREILEVTLAENRLDPSVNLTEIAERLEGYTGSDIKEVCREAVVQISHEQARLLDQGMFNSRKDVTQGSLQRLRPVTSEDFDKALNKLKRSVSEKGRELAKVWEWNDEYGEIKKEKNHLPQLMNMYL